VSLVVGDTMRLGIDLGGTKIACAVLDDAGQIVWERRTPTPRDDYDATVGAMAALVAGAERDLGTSCTVGVGMPGAISPAPGLVKNANSTWLNGRALQPDLERAMGRPVRLANDANCLAVSEAVDGAAAGANVVFAVIAGTGTGGGIFSNGGLVTGANAIAGEWGHNPLPWPGDDERPGPECYCGRRGCIETFLSGPGLAADHVRGGGEAVASEVVVARALAGDVLAASALDRWCDRAARALATVVNLLDPDVIVVGGGLSRIDLLYSRVPDLWSPWIFSDQVATRLVRARYGDASGVRGAAWLW
jgi:fructokinase